MQSGMEALKANLDHAIGATSKKCTKLKQTAKIVRKITLNYYGKQCTLRFGLLEVVKSRNQWKYREEDVMTSCNAEKLTKGKQLILHLLRKQSCSSGDNMFFLWICSMWGQLRRRVLWICPNHLFSKHASVQLLLHSAEQRCQLSWGADWIRGNVASCS